MRLCNPVFSVIDLWVKYLLSVSCNVEPLRITHLPSGCGEYVLISLIVTPFHNLSGMRFVLLLGGIRKQAHVLVRVKVEEGTGLAPRLVDDKVVERVVVGNNEILLHVHQIVDADSA